MEPSGALPARNRSTVLFAILAIALLFIGIGAGYYVGRPATASLPGPVDGLARTSAVPRVDGWFRNASVTYLDFGTQAKVAVPILVFFQDSSPTTPVAGQRNIIDTIPGQPGHGDFWRAHQALVPSGDLANTVHIFPDALVSGLTILAPVTVLNCVLVKTRRY